MGKNKISRFRENATFKCMVQPEFDEVFRKDYKLKTAWNSTFFEIPQPIVLELGCGRGEYTVGLGEKFLDKNFIGVDIKGARMWRGAKTATENGMNNIGFLRTRIEFIESFFGECEVDEIWVTFPDPQLKQLRVKKRLTSPGFLAMYARFLKPGGIVHLKTDCQHLHEYTKAVVVANSLEVIDCNNDIYGTGFADEIRSIKTTYEKQFLAEGLPITYLSFRLGDRKEFVAPNFEPDLLLAK